MGGSGFVIDTNFQTPEFVCEYMANMASSCEKSTPQFPLNPFPKTVLEPTPGMGNICKALNSLNPRVFQVHTPIDDFWQSCWHLRSIKFDAVVMNPPFTPYQEMTRFVDRALELSDTVIALLPVNYITSEKRAKGYAAKGFGLISVTMLPRRTFTNMVATCILELKKGYSGDTQFKRLFYPNKSI